MTDAVISQVSVEVLRSTPPTLTDLVVTTDAIRCILVEPVASVASVETTRYLSSRPYVDEVNGRVYTPNVRSSSVRLVERININGKSSINSGDIEFDNTEGTLDTWFDDVWVNRNVNVLVGDVRDPRSSFQIIFNGVIEDIGTRARDTVNLRIRDKLNRLNVPVSEEKLGGATSNKNELLPICLGECFNISPLLTNPATLEFQFNKVGSESIIEVRDNGVPVSVTADLGNGKFTLLTSPAGKITASVQGELSIDFKTTVRGIVQRLISAYGEPPENRFGGVDIDLANFDTFDAANQQPIGVYISRRQNLLSICSKIASSVGAQLVMSREGKLQLIKAEVPPAGSYRAINSSNMTLGSLRIRDKIEVQAGFKIGYDKNWAVQDGLLTGIPEEHKALFAQEWLTVTASDAAVKSAYKIDEEPKQIDTFLLVDADATTEANRLLALFKVPRFSLEFEGYAELMDLRLGDYVTITNSRFGLDAGKNGTVVGLSLDWDKYKVTVEVLV